MAAQQARLLVQAVQSFFFRPRAEGIALKVRLAVFAWAPAEWVYEPPQ
jgi:hypothetical protein